MRKCVEDGVEEAPEPGERERTDRRHLLELARGEEEQRGLVRHRPAQLPRRVGLQRRASASCTSSLRSSLFLLTVSVFTSTSSPKMLPWLLQLRSTSPPEPATNSTNRSRPSPALTDELQYDSGFRRRRIVTRLLGFCVQVSAGFATPGHCPAHPLQRGVAPQPPLPIAGLAPVHVQPVPRPGSESRGEEGTALITGAHSRLSSLRHLPSPWSVGPIANFSVGQSGVVWVAWTSLHLEPHAGPLSTSCPPPHTNLPAFCLTLILLPLLSPALAVVADFPAGSSAAVVNARH